MATIILALIENTEQAFLVEQCLTDAGHHVQIASTFVKAKALLKANSYDLIVTDVYLENGGSVFDFLKWAKSQPRLKSIPFILFSLEPSALALYLSHGVQTTARLLGAARYITMKKFDPELLRRTIDELLPDADRPVGVKVDK